jgi:hypothetical protein
MPNRIVHIYTQNDVCSYACGSEDFRACHTLPMYLAGTKPEQKMNNGEKIGGAPARKLTVAIPM